ncbi:DBR1-domain-containing protein [Artomyces pyxidatus]|uniref:DBR1-domain-containing protein n=1 Tax=Artomyces pyxidatus TaxID=48021 RepID=A0ACB8TD85_9AGAM|nr:DBR1-domain-containing protein [Artomyces pyxidatus]
MKVARAFNFLRARALSTHSRGSLKIAVEGCCHGELESTYRQIAKLESQNNYKVDLLLICGDFQAIRNHQDLQCMAVPQKYKRLGEFHKYYTGEATAPILTIVIGGNHEASNYMWELYHGGWLAPNIYFLGHAGCVQVNGIRIAGASGIFKQHDFRLGHLEKLPYDNSAVRSIYHIREYNVRRLSLLSSPQIFLSHDWPQGIEQHGDLNALLRRKPFFRQDAITGALGSPPLMDLLRNLKPEYWFAAHMHVRFEATFAHDTPAPQAQTAANPDEIAIITDDDLDGEQAATAEEEKRAEFVHSNPDEILLDDEEETVAEPPAPPPPRFETKFLALDKCLPNRQFLEIVDVQVPAEFANAATPVLAYDAEWLAITRAFAPLLSTARQQPPFPKIKDAWERVETNLEWVRANVAKKLGADWRVDACQTFAMTAPGPAQAGNARGQQPAAYPNPQTQAFTDMLEIPNKIK